jgi:hypothetical protein
MAGREVTAILKSTDVAGTLDWYRRIGFEVRSVFPEDEPTWCEVSRDASYCSSSVARRRGRDLLRSPEPSTSIPRAWMRSSSRSRDTRPPPGVRRIENGVARELGLQDPNGYFLTFTEPAQE